MAKSKEEIENRIVAPVIPLRRPSIEETKTANIGMRCSCCNERIYNLLDDYIFIDEDTLFCSDHCAAEFYINDAGGHRVYGGAC